MIIVYICLLNPKSVSIIVIEVMPYVKMAFTREAEDRKEMSGNKFCHHEAFPGFLAHARLLFLKCYFIWS